jgi:dTMP kinase
MSTERNGILIAVEGIDGAGKTTQVRLLSERLQLAGMDVVSSKEPTDGPWGARVRQSAITGRLPLEDETHAFLEDRKEHVRDLVAPALEAGKVVILDRYFYSTIAYQGARGQDVQDLIERTAQFPRPDITFLIDIDPAVAVSRIANGRGETPNQFERAEYLAEARKIFNRVAAKDEAIRSLDGGRSIEALHDEVVAAFINGPLKQRRCYKSYDCDLFYCTARLTGMCQWFDLQLKIRQQPTPLAAR